MLHSRMDLGAHATYRREKGHEGLSSSLVRIPGRGGYDLLHVRVQGLEGPRPQTKIIIADLERAYGASGLSTQPNFAPAWAPDCQLENLRYRLTTLRLHLRHGI